MRCRIFVAAAVIGMLALPASALFADQAVADEAGVGPSQGEPLPAQPGNLADTVHARDLIGKSAYDANGRTVGTITDLLLATNGHVEAAIVNVGGILGINQHLVAVAWKALTIAPRDNRITISMTRDQLKSAPKYSATTGTAVTSAPPQQAKTPQQ